MAILPVVTSFTLVFTIYANQAKDNTTQTSAIPLIEAKKCRLANYMIKFDLLHGESNVGKATRELKQANKHSDVHLLSSLTASMAFVKFIQKERSVMKDYIDTGFYSSEFSKYVKKPFKKEIKQIYTIDALDSNNGLTLLDPLSVYDHLRELACSGLKANITLNVQEEKEVTQYHFEYKGEETLQLPMGEAQTIFFVRTRKTSTRETSIWFNINQYFLPVKIQQEKDGDTQAVLVAKSIDAALLR